MERNDPTGRPSLRGRPCSRDTATTNSEFVRDYADCGLPVVAPSNVKSSARQQCEQRAAQNYAQAKSEAGTAAKKGFVGGLLVGTVVNGVAGCVIGGAVGGILGGIATAVVGGEGAAAGLPAGCGAAGFANIVAGTPNAVLTGVLTAGVFYYGDMSAAGKQYQQDMQACVNQ